MSHGLKIQFSLLMTRTFEYPPFDKPMAWRSSLGWQVRERTLQIYKAGRERAARGALGVWGGEPGDVEGQVQQPKLMVVSIVKWLGDDLG